MLAILQSEWQAARATLDFIEDVGFSDLSEDEESHMGAVKTITFHYKQAGSEQDMELEIPLLSLIPIPYLNISEAQYDMRMMIRPRKSSSASTGSFFSELTSEHSKSRQNLNIQVQLAQASLPSGIQYLLQKVCLLYTSPSPRDRTRHRMPSSA